MLTTPEITENDDVFPGEKWFLYWKTSASLWESRLRNFAVGAQIYIPINWGVHCENPDQYDFGEVKPETDIFKLYQLAMSLNIKVSFVIAAGPMPFISNGGVPSFLAKTKSVSKDGVQIFSIDRSDQIHKMFSFYSPRIYQYYAKFLKALNSYFVKKGISAEVIGAKTYYHEESKAISYFDDYSKEFEAGFHRYLNQVELEKPDFIENLKIDKTLELKAKSDYKELIEGLYTECLKQELGVNLIGFRDFLFLGAGLKENIERSMTRFSDKNNYFKSLFFAIFNNYVPSSVLLSSGEKDMCLNEALKNIVKKDFIEAHLKNQFFDEDSSSFKVLDLFNLFMNKSSFNRLGLNNFFDIHFKCSYQVNPPLDEVDDKVYIFAEENLDDASYSFALRNFMNGGVVFLDESSLSVDQQRKLNIFLTENSITTQKVRLGVIVQSASLGQGSLFLFNAKELKELNDSKKMDFWNKILSTVEIKHPRCESDDGVYFIWQNRFTNSYELDYEEIRRLSIYNPSDYKKKMKVSAHKNLAFLKSIDQRDAQIKSSNKSVEIELKPKASISLDFGLFE